MTLVRFQVVEAFEASVTKITFTQEGWNGDNGIEMSFVFVFSSVKEENPFASTGSTGIRIQDFLVKV